MAPLSFPSTNSDPPFENSQVCDRTSGKCQMFEFVAPMVAVSAGRYLTLVLKCGHGK